MANIPPNLWQFWGMVCYCFTDIMNENFMGILWDIKPTYTVCRFQWDILELAELKIMELWLGDFPASC